MKIGYLNLVLIDFTSIHKPALVHALVSSWRNYLHIQYKLR